MAAWCSTVGFIGSNESFLVDLASLDDRVSLQVADKIHFTELATLLLLELLSKVAGDCALTFMT